MTCSECGAPFAADADPRRLTCSTSCRVRRHRRQRREDTRGLLTRALAALHDGDVDALTAVDQDARALLGADQGRRV